MFRILAVDDDPIALRLLEQVMKNLHRRHELSFAADGMEALDFLHGRGAHLDAPRPNLILLDMNMPRMNGLETLSAIKNDPELGIIPVIMLSTEVSPRIVRQSYQAHANCYVQKPRDLNGSLKLAQAIDAFWMEFALLPPAGWKRMDRPVLDVPDRREPASGARIAASPVEPNSQPENIAPPKAGTALLPDNSGCEEHNRLLEEFGLAVHELLRLHEQWLVAIGEGDAESHRFDLLIHMANENKQIAKYNFIRHTEAHQCSNQKAL